MAELIVQRSYYPAILVARLINVVVGIVEVVLILRILLELFGANSVSRFVNWIYGVSAVLLGPFAGSFAPLSLGNRSEFDIAAVLAMVAYVFTGWFFIQLLSFIFVSASRIN